MKKLFTSIYRFFAGTCQTCGNEKIGWRGGSNVCPFHDLTPGYKTYHYVKGSVTIDKEKEDLL